MSKHLSSSIPSTAEKTKTRRRIDSPVSKSDSSSDLHDESEMTSYPHLRCLVLPRSLLWWAPDRLMGDDDMLEWRKKFSLPSSVVLRAPSLLEGASSCMSEEITVYEAFFDYGFRGEVPSLIAELCIFFRISPSQLNPPAWRILTAIQNLRDLECLSFGVNEVLYAYHLAPINGGEGRFHLRPQSGLPIVEKL